MVDNIELWMIDNFYQKVNGANEGRTEGITICTKTSRSP